MRDAAPSSATPSVSMPPDLLAAVDRVAAKRGWKRSFLIREIVRDWMNDHNEPIGKPIEQKAS